VRKEKGNPIIDINYAINGRSLNDIIITDCYRGEIWASVPETSLLSMEIETFGFACLLISFEDSKLPSQEFLNEMKNLTSIPLKNLSNSWNLLPQKMIEEQNTPLPLEIPQDMVLIPEGKFLFNSTGLEIEGPDDSGVDVQFPWKHNPNVHIFNSYLSLHFI